MDSRVTVLERAFQLAKSGEYTSIARLKQRLKAEGRPSDQIVGRSLFQQLEALMKEAATAKGS